MEINVLDSRRWMLLTLDTKRPEIVKIIIFNKRNINNLFVRIS